MSAILNHAVMEGGLAANQLAIVPKVVVRTEERKIFDPGELKRLFPADVAALKTIWGSLEMAMAMLIVRDAGLRPSELVALRWEHWRPKYKGFIVHPRKTAHKGAKIKAALVSDFTAKLIADYAPDLGNVSSWSRVDTLGKQFCRLAEAVVPLGGRTLYCLRHTANTRLLTAVGDEAAKLVMGHTTDAMTAHYDHPDDVAIMERARKLVK